MNNLLGRAEGELHQQPLSVLCFLIFLAVIPVTLVVPILKPLVLDRYAVSPFAAHAFLSANMVGAILAAPLVGWVLDRVGRCQPIVVVAFLLDALLLLGLGVAPNYVTLMIIRFFEGITHIVALTGIMGVALAMAHHNPVRSAPIMGAVGASIVFAVACGSGLGGALSKSGITHPLIGATIISFLGAIISGWFLRHERTNSSYQRIHGLHALANIICKDRAILIPCIFTFSDRLLVGIIISSFNLYLVQHLGWTPKQFGFLMSTLLFPFGLLCYPFGRLCRTWSKSIVIVSASLLYAIFVAALAWIDPGWFFPSMLLLGVISALNFSPSLALVADLAGSESRSTAMGAFNSAGSLGFFIGPLMGGTLVQSMLSGGVSVENAYKAAFIFGGGVSFLTTICAIPFLVHLVRTGKTT